MYVHGSEERLIQAAKGNRIASLEAASVLKKVKKEKSLTARLVGESFTWSVFETN